MCPYRKKVKYVDLVSLDKVKRKIRWGVKNEQKGKIIKEELSRLKENLKNSSRFGGQDSIRCTISCKKRELEEIPKRVSLIEAFEAIASLKEDLDDSHVCMV